MRARPGSAQLPLDPLLRRLIAHGDRPQRQRAAIGIAKAALVARSTSATVVQRSRANNDNNINNIKCNGAHFFVADQTKVPHHLIRGRSAAVTTSGRAIVAKISVHLSYKSLSALPGASRGRRMLEEIRRTVEEMMRDDWKDEEVAVDYQDPRRDTGKTVIEIIGIETKCMEEVLLSRVSGYLRRKLDRTIEAIDLEVLDVAGQEIYNSMRGWEAELARDLCVDEHLVQAWLSRQRAVPGWVIAELPELLSGKAAELRKKATGLSRFSARLRADQAPVRSDGCFESD
nr:hypothetical protein [uncultured Rhodopila sp.]